VRKEVPCFRKKIVPIIGDLNIEDFGLSENDKKILISKVIISDYAYYSFTYTLLYSNVKKIIVYLNRYIFHIYVIITQLKYV